MATAEPDVRATRTAFDAVHIALLFATGERNWDVAAKFIDQLQALGFTIVRNDAQT